jgi:hypothetical protein
MHDLEGSDVRALSHELWRFSADPKDFFRPAASRFGTVFNICDNANNTSQWLHQMRKKACRLRLPP